MRLLPSGKWARLYEEGTLRPIYGDRDGKVHYRLEEISEERRTGYSWESDYGASSAIASARQLLTGHDAVRSKASPRPKGLWGRAKQVIARCDAQGRFIRKGYLSIGDFVRNGNVLCAFLESLK